MPGGEPVGWSSVCGLVHALHTLTERAGFAGCWASQTSSFHSGGHQLLSSFFGTGSLNSLSTQISPVSDVTVVHQCFLETVERCKKKKLHEWVWNTKHTSWGKNKGRHGTTGETRKSKLAACDLSYPVSDHRLFLLILCLHFTESELKFLLDQKIKVSCGNFGIRRKEY